MTPDGPNPELMQKKPRVKKNIPALPLVLIHDGGGTTAGFWSLGKLQRDVWVIHNPKFWSGASWQRGMDEMALHYLSLIRARGISGRIVLGGWSLGGFLSLAIARMIAALGKQDEGSLEISGLLIIDSPYFEPWYEQSPPVSQPLLPDMLPKVKQTYEKCDDLLSSWSLPRWGWDAMGGEPVTLRAGGNKHIIPHRAALYKPLDSDWVVKKTAEEPTTDRPGARIDMEDDRAEHDVEKLSPPMGILIRCVGRTPALDQGHHPCRVDLYRDSLTLGWGQGYEDYIKVVMDATNTHYTIFDRNNRSQIKHVTSLLNQALDIFDQRELGSMASI
ncbi:Alpha/Beta hydrolase protein [Emericellopsis atlantica]|uniref:Alpha/Beta hydrolase protein n=1 Tax=Emericellopsis atlantica TaxID=2614577 RepID=A0A9P8CJW7_9HYPO|nr:Alpha/Beta hydrolase protein [Emericellopsis atlantica]KAG9249432.1 Alpha/Beta hydrolase protein [Emericellopsis atlantica]